MTGLRSNRGSTKKKLLHILTPKSSCIFFGMRNLNFFPEPPYFGLMLGISICMNQLQILIKLTKKNNQKTFSK